MRFNIFLTLLLPMFMLVVLLIFFNTSTFRESIDSSLQQRMMLESDLIVERLERCLEKYNTDSGLEIDSQAVADLNLISDQFDRITSLQLLQNGTKEIYGFPEKGAASGLNNARSDEKETTPSLINNLLKVRPLPFKSERMLGLKLKEPVLISLTLTSSSAVALSRINFVINIFLTVFFLICAYVAVSSWISNALERPLALMLSAQEKIARGEYDARLHTELANSNELTQTYASFNNMATELQSSRDELEKKNKTLAELNESYKNLNEKLEMEVQHKTQELREYFSLISHDLKVPIAAAKGYTDLLMRPKTGPLNDKQKEFIKNISLTHGYLLNLVRNMIDSVKYEGGKISYFFECFDIDEVVEECESNVMLSIQERNLHFRVVRPSDEKLFVWGDKVKITRVISNLLSNAIKISPDDSDISLIFKEKDDTVEICVSDEGCGISRENISKIFDKFTQFPYGDKTSGGMGLGLYIVNKIIEGHERKIEVKSEVGQGTSFSFELNRCKPGN